MASTQQDPETTPLDRHCAFFVRDALFPLRRDWGSKWGAGYHHQIHPALMALDRLRRDLIELRPNSTSFSNIFPRGVLLVSRSDALVGSTTTTTTTTSSSEGKAMEYNGQPDVDESSASVEVIPNLLTVKCMRCNGSPFLPVSSSSKAFVREKYKAWKNPQDDDYEASKEYEVVLCSDRTLQKDYYYDQAGRNEQHRREDLPIRSMGAVEEALAREITKLRVQEDGSIDANTGKLTSPLSYPLFPTKELSSSKENVAASCEAFAQLELLAARAAECLLVSNRDDATGKTTETRMGSAIFPKSIVSALPNSLQRNFANRCAVKVATQHVVAEAKKSKSELPIRPRDCVQRARTNNNTQT